MAETRKLAAILAADVAGYSKLVGAEADACHAARVRRNRWRERHRIPSVVDAITQGLSGLAVSRPTRKHVYERRLVRQLVVG